METASAPDDEAPANDDGLIGQLGRGGLTAIKDYRLIMLALDHGMSKQDIAKAQGICIRHLRLKMRLLRKISDEVADLFEGARITNPTFSVLGKMTARRQLEVAKLMIITGNYSCEFATALLAATPQRGLVESNTVRGITPRQRAGMSRDIKALQQGLGQVQSSYGRDMLHLTVAAAYVRRLMSNSEIVAYLGCNYPDLLEGFRAIVASS